MSKVFTVQEEDTRDPIEVTIGATFGNHAAAIEQIAPDSMVIFEDVQRRYRPLQATRLARNYDHALTGVFTLNTRTDGSLAVVDGQHRRAAAQIAGFGHIPVTCYVYHGLTLQEEAILFLALNDSRKVPSADLFRVGLVKGDPTVVGIYRALTERGLVAGGTNSKTNYMAIKTAINIWQDAGQMTGEEAFCLALDVVLAAWTGPDGRGRPGYLNGEIIHGIALLGLNYGKAFSPERMVKALSGFGGGPSSLLGTIRGRKTTLKGTMATVSRVVLTELYNKGLGARQGLPTDAPNSRETPPEVD